MSAALIAALASAQPASAAGRAVLRVSGNGDLGNRSALVEQTHSAVKRALDKSANSVQVTRVRLRDFRGSGDDRLGSLPGLDRLEVTRVSSGNAGGDISRLREHDGNSRLLSRNGDGGGVFVASNKGDSSGTPGGTASSGTSSSFSSDGNSVSGGNFSGESGTGSAVY